VRQFDQLPRSGQGFPIWLSEELLVMGEAAEVKSEELLVIGSLFCLL
jgi:hypothetical protein